MSLDYKPVLWNRQKKLYDRWILILILVYLSVYAGGTILLNSEVTPETLIIRSFGTLALVMLHIILAIGPASRLNKRLLPLLYNRRHLGVTMFFMAAIHGVFSIIQFHTLGNTNALVSIFVSNQDYASLVNLPFQVLGFFALIILFMMAATSHDFWLANLGPRTWKTLHMMVYLAYVLLLLHVFLGALQQENPSGFIIVFGAGFIGLITLHLLAGFRELVQDKPVRSVDWVMVGKPEDIVDKRAKVVVCDDERVAIFKYGKKLSAVSNVCKHQNGPLGEGKIVDGCITCPWHGYQYYPHNGQSPPPFEEKVSTYELKLEGELLYVKRIPHPEGTPIEPLTIE